jgi:AcrR family transcriptional regulator
MNKREKNWEGTEAYERLVDAVVATVHEYGYAGATMDRIAQKAGYTRGAIQHYFGNRRVDLMSRVTSELLSSRQKKYEARFNIETAPPLVTSRDGLKAAFREPETWFLIEVWIASKGDPELHSRISQLQDKVEKLSDAMLEISARNFTSTSFRVLKAYLRSLTRGLALEYSRRPDPALFDDVVDLAFDALEALDRKI